MLHSIYQSGDYPFLYTHLVGDANSTANDRLTIDYNFAGYPSGFFDGGYEVDAAYPFESNYRLDIEKCGTRPVPDLDLKAALEWLGDASLRVTVAIGFNGSANEAPDSLWLSGDPSAAPNLECSFEVSCVDPEGDAVYYQMDWGNGFSAWLGPYASGEVQKLDHAWSQAGLYNVRVRARDLLGDTTAWSTPQSILINSLPTKPVVTGVQSGLIHTEYSFEAVSSDADSHVLLYEWNWGGGIPEPLMGPYASGETCVATRSFTGVGSYEISARARDPLGGWSLWSDPHQVLIAATCCTVPGDVNDDESGPDIADLVYLVNYMFKQGPAPACVEEADVNAVDGLDIADLVYLVNYMFKSGPEPAACR